MASASQVLAKNNGGDSFHVCLVSCFPPSRGPLSEYTFHLAKHLSLSQEISKVTVVADEVGIDEKSFDEKIDVVRCWKLNDPLTPFRILKMICTIKPDIVHFNLLFRHFSSRRITNFLGLCTPTIVRLLNMPIVVTLHSLAEDLDLELAGYSNSLLNRVGSRLATRLLLNSTLLTVPHKHLLGILKRNYGAKNVIYLPHGVFRRGASNTEVGGKRFLIFGKMGRYKNAALVLEAFREISSSITGLELVIAGPPHPLEPEILRLTTQPNGNMPNVRFQGYVPEDQLEALFASAIAVILPYTICTWSSGVFSLASGFGRPVIASDLPDFRELQEEGAGIILFQSGNKLALVRSMHLLLQDEKLQRRLSQENKLWAAEHSFDNVVSQIVDEYKKILQRKTN